MILVCLLIDFVFLNISTLELKHDKFGLHIRILHEISSLEPAAKVWKPMSRTTTSDFVLFSINKYIPIFLVYLKDIRSEMLSESRRT